MAEEVLPGKVSLECQLVCLSSWLLNDRCSWEAEKARCIGDKEAPVWRSCQPQHPKHIQFNAMDVHIGNAIGCKSAGISLQYPLGLLLRLGRICSNSIRNGMWNATRESVLVPLRWNITFDNILKKEVPLGVSIICCTDDTPLVMAEDDISMLE